MKNFYLIILLILTTSSGFAQIPSNYYDSANGLTGFTLKTQLKNIISNGHNDQGYGALYSGYVTTHSDNISESGYENDNTVLLFYTENPSGTDSYTYNHGSNNCGNYNSEADCYNREHIIPQSAFGSASPMQNDIHHVIPSDGFVNGQRGSLPFGTVGSANWTSQNGSKRGSSSLTGYSGTVFEPIDEFKGDIARSILYFVTRYENTVDGYTSFDMFNGTEDQALEDWAIDMLLDWHYNIDPVDQHEIDRNNAAYNYQGNANPFVDHPEYVNLIWNPNPDTESPTNPTNLIASNPTDDTIELDWTLGTDNVGVVAHNIYINDVLSGPNMTSNPSFIALGLNPNTTYCFKVSALDAAGNESGLSNEACATTSESGTGGGVCTSESFENIGTSSSSYSNVSWTGDDGITWNATDARTDQTLDNRAITVRNGSLEKTSLIYGIEELTVTTQRVFSGSSGTFDLIVNGIVVGTIPYDDTPITSTIVVGNLNASSLVINNNSTASNRVMFDNISWTCGQLSAQEYELDNVKLHPNPISNNLMIDLDSNIDTKIEIFDILGKLVYKQNINMSSILDLQSLKTGVHIIKITQNNTSINKKIIKQ
ncbi:endonuclease [uncultured Winogradskyella sp.]|uniref:endonuclease n=1 Tax=uncultured Winogradskyella sp. TaxID=395353 RepID=UPI00260E3D98|nr:endonuclease [uncultured Winogradskyella sp.]